MRHPLLNLKKGTEMRECPRSFRLSFWRRFIKVRSSLLMVAGSMFFLAGSPLAQNGTDSVQLKKEMMDDISDYAITICPSQSTKSRNETTEWGVKGEFGLNKLLSKLASVSADAEYQSRIEDAEGLLQKDLPTVLKDTIDCRVKVTDLFLKTLFARSNPPFVPEDLQPDASKARAEMNIGRQISTYIMAGTSNNPELNASRRLQRKLEDFGYQVLSAQERGTANIVIEISMGQGDDVACSAETYGQCSLKIDAYYRAYWRESRKPILAPDILSESASGIPSVALDKAADKAARAIVLMLNERLKS